MELAMVNVSGQTLLQPLKSVVDDDPELDDCISYLQACRPAEFLRDRPRKGTLHHQPEVLEFMIAGDTFEMLQSFCQKGGLSEIEVLLAAFRATHYRLSGAEDAAFAINDSSHVPQGSANAIASKKVVRVVQVSVDDHSFGDLIHQIQETLTGSKDGRMIPFEKVMSRMVKNERLSGRPLIPILFDLHSDAEVWRSLPVHGTESTGSPVTSMFDVEFHLLREAQRFKGKILFRSQILEPGTICSIVSVFRSVLQAGMSQPKTPIKSLPLMKHENYTVLQRMGLLKTPETEYPRDSSVIDLFRQQVTSCPLKIAIKDSVTELTYAELDTLSDSIAQWLGKRLFPAETMIGVFADRTCNTVAVFLGILKSNLAYLPFDVRSPINRIETILSSISGPRMVLVGEGIDPPVLQLEGVEFVPFQTAFTHSAHTSLQKQTTITASPSATSLAYVMFTSGSTGAPKGVMVEHRGIVRLVRGSNMADELPPSVIMAHLSNTAFDAATWEIYGALLNGGTLVCIDTMTLLDYSALSNKLARESIQTAFFTTALLKQYARDCPSILSQLKMICAGGEVFDPHDMAAALNLMKGRFIHMYGPTENTTFSAMYPVCNRDFCLARVPIGYPISNSGAFVMDAQQRLVPLGVVGELVVTGDGLARGYTDPKLNQNRFVSIEIDGKHMRGYRTGDAFRIRAWDGQLDFIGRLDGQVKIRGNRVELGEIEHTIRSHPSVCDAAAVLQKDNRDEPQIACFVTMHPHMKPERQTILNGDESKRVEAWSHLYDESIYAPMKEMSPEKIGRDFTGWTSMYDGQPLDGDEMNEWLDDTIEGILNGGQPGHVLEIGTGSGMILFNLVNGLQSYVGLDPSEAAFNFVSQISKAHPVLADRVRLYKASALDIPHLDGSLTPDLVVLNSVVQYFPSHEYLFRVIEDILHLPNVKSIFFGDIRSQALYKEFRVTRALRIFGDGLHRNELLSQISEDEGELLVDPGFFTSLSSRLPDLVEHVEILPKRMKATNELSCYRYAAVVHVRRKDLQKCHIHPINENDWIDFRERGLDRQSLLQLLQRSSSSTIPVSNIPYSKSIFERFAVESILDPTKAAEGADWFSDASQQARKCPCLSPTDLVEVSRQSKYHVEISWARQYSLRGGFDVVFHRRDPVNGDERVMFRFPTDHHGREWDSLCSHPLRLQAKQELQKQLQETFKSKLPSYMVPKQIKILDKLPMNQNGKVDRRVLEQMIQSRATPKELLRQPTTEAERQMRMIWAEVLNINVSTFGLDHSFFDLGGTSIDAMRIVGLARKAGFELTVQEIFRQKKLGHLVPDQIHNGDASTPTFQTVEFIDPVMKKDILAELDALNIGINSTVVADVLPITSIQNEFLYCATAWRQYIDYYYMDVENENLNLDTFKKSCSFTLERYPILRTCFIRVVGKYWQFVLHQLNSPLHIEDVEGDLDELFDKFVLNGLQQLSEHESPLKIMLFRDRSQRVRLAVRMHHAQNDALSIPIIFKSLLEDHSQSPQPPLAPTFSHFMTYVHQKRPSAIGYWKDLLKGASITQIKPKLRPNVQVAELKPLAVHASTNLPVLADNSIMISTIVNAAWTVLLARLTGQTDIAYWQFIAGRNSAIRGVEDIVGPCMSAAPTRVMLSSLETPLQLLRFIQDQLMATGEADSLSNDIVEECTDWPSGIMDSVIQHQSFGETPHLECCGANRPIRFFENPYLLEPYPWLASFAKENRLHISLFATTGLITTDRANCLVRDMCTIATELGKGYDMPLEEWMQRIHLDVLSV